MRLLIDTSTVANASQPTAACNWPALELLMAIHRTTDVRVVDDYDRRVQAQYNSVLGHLSVGLTWHTQMTALGRYDLVGVRLARRHRTQLAASGFPIDDLFLIEIAAAANAVVVTDDGRLLATPARAYVEEKIGVHLVGTCDAAAELGL